MHPVTLAPRIRAVKATASLLDPALSFRSLVVVAYASEKPLSTGVFVILRAPQNALVPVCLSLLLYQAGFIEAESKRNRNVRHVKLSEDHMKWFVPAHWFPTPRYCAYLQLSNLLLLLSPVTTQ